MFSFRLLLPTILICIFSFLIGKLFFLHQPHVIDNFRHFFRNKEIQLSNKEKIIQYIKSLVFSYLPWILFFAVLQFYWVKTIIKSLWRKQIPKSQKQKNYQPVLEEEETNSRIQQYKPLLFERKFGLKEYMNEKSIIVSTFLIFVLSFCLCKIVESQSKTITHEFKFGKNNWMEMNQYISIDYFHNLPEQFKKDQTVKSLFLQQDKSLYGLRIFILNYRLFFGIIRLAYSSVGIFFLIFIFIGVFFLNVNKHIQSQLEHIVQHSNPKKQKKKKFRIIFGFIFGNFLIFVFWLFLCLASIMSEINQLNSPHICYKNQLVGGFTINFIPQTQMKIFELIQQKKQNPQKLISPFQSYTQSNLNLNRHNIIFLYQNLCEITNPFFVRIKALQNVILYVLRIGYLFILFVILSIHLKFLQTSQKIR